MELQSSTLRLESVSNVEGIILAGFDRERASSFLQAYVDKVA